MSGHLRASLLAVAGFVILVCGAAAIQRWAIYPAFQKLESDRAREDVSRVVEAIRREIHHLGSIAEDWAYWDDTYGFIESRDPAFVQANVTWATIETSARLNLVCICDRQGNVLISEAHDTQLGGTLSLTGFPKDTLSNVPSLLAGSEGGAPVNGLMMTEFGPMLVVARPVLTSQGLGPPRGTLVFGRFLDDGICRAVAAQARVRFELLPLDSPRLSAAQRAWAAGLVPGRSRFHDGGMDDDHVYEVMADLHGVPTLVVRATRDRHITALGFWTSFYALGFTVITVLVFVLAAALWLARHPAGGPSGRMAARGAFFRPAVLLTGLAGLTLTGGAFYGAWRHGQSVLRNAFDLDASQQARGIEAAITQPLAAVRAMQTFYACSEQVTRQEFHMFARNWADACGAASYAWAPRVTGERRGAFEAQAAADGLAGFRICEREHGTHLKRAGDRDVYFPLTFIEPLRANESALGYDLASEPARLAAMEKARDTGCMAATGLLRILRAPGEQPGVLVFAPVYAAGKPLATVAERRDALAGFVVGAFRVVEIIDAAVARGTRHGLLVDVLDLCAAGEGQRLHACQSGPSEGRPSDASVGAIPGLAGSHDFSVADRAWRVELRAAPTYAAQRRLVVPWLLLPGGLLLTMLTMLYLHNLATQRQRAETLVAIRTAELRESEERFSHAFHNSPVLMALSTIEDGRILDVNACFLKTLGYERDEVIGRTSTELGLFAEPEQRARVVERVQRDGVVRGVEVRARAKNGSVCTGLFSADTLHLQGGPCLLTVMVDISEVKRTEDNLRRSEEKYRELVENANSIILRMDRTGNILFFNEFAERFFGYREETILGRNVVGTIVPETETSGRDLREMILDIGRNPERYAVNENENIRCNGDRAWVAWTNRAICNAQGEVEEILCIGTDISARKRAEAELEASEIGLRTLIESVPAGVVLIDAETSLIAEVNPWACSLIGARRQDVVGKPSHALICPAERGAGPVSDLGVTVGHSEATLLTAGGERRPVLRSVAPVTMGGRRCLVESYVDIAERKQAEAIRLDMERQLLHAQKLESLGVLTGGIAHDFNNLLTAILGNLEMARHGLPPGAPAQGQLDQALRATHRATELTRQMLAYSGRGQFVVRSVDINAEVLAHLGMFRAATAKTASLATELAPDLPPIDADPAQVQQVIMNLVTNASEALGDRTGEISIRTGVCDADAACLSRSRTEAKPPPGRFVFLDVVDNGCGMDEATQQRVFEPFFSTKFTGRGLGMAVVQGIVRGHRGAILLDGAVGRGTTVRILFPVSAGQAVAAPPPALPATQTPDAVFQRDPERGFGGSTILVVDDEDMVRDVCKEMLEELGFDVLTASDGQEGIETFRTHADRIVCAVLDVSMPRMDGLQVLAELRRLRPDVRAILSSGFTEHEAARRFAGSRTTAFISKPYVLKTLSDALRRVLGAAISSA